MSTLHVPAQRPGPTIASVPGAAPRGPADGQGTAVELVDLGWRRILRVSAARVVLTVVASLLVWSLLPLLVGWTPRLILSGSMEPRIHVGDVVVTRTVPAATLRPGQVITVQDPDHPGRTRTHRVQRLAADGTIVTKGDANPQADSSHVAPGKVLGLGVLRVPFVGRPAYWVAQHNWLGVGATALLLSWAGVSAFAATRRPRRLEDDRDDRDDQDDRDDRDGDGEPRSRSHGARRRVRQAAAVAAAGAVAVGMGVAPAEAAFRTTAANPVSTLAAAASFSSATYASVVQGDAPQFYWRLGESSGSTAADAVGTRTGKLNGSWTWGQTGALPSQTGNTALHVDGGYVDQSAALSSGTAFSVEAWFRTSRTTGGALMSLVTTSGVDRSLYLGTDGKLRFGRNGSAGVTSPTALNDGHWHHVVYTNASSGPQSAKLYVDGAMVASSNAGLNQSATGTWRAGQATWTGTWPGTPDQYFRGDLDEIAVYTSALTAAQVSAHWTASGS
ncbi:MAG: signal peptidase I [Marmoricola sp.]|nr:signal peptidase I [Marmoricola sp.]